MFGGTGISRRLAKVTESWFWDDLREAVSGLVRSRSVWAVAGNAGVFFSALAALLHYWSRPISFGDYAVVQLVCLAWQVIALIPVAWPGRSATARDVEDASGLHEGLTLTTVCGTWIFGVFPAAGLLVLFGVDVDSPPWAALLFSGTALMLACVAGLMTGTALSGMEGRQHREAGGPPDAPDPGDGRSGAEADSGGGGFDGGFDGD